MWLHPGSTLVWHFQFQLPRPNSIILIVENVLETIMNWQHSAQTIWTLRCWNPRSSCLVVCTRMLNEVTVWVEKHRIDLGLTYTVAIVFTEGVYYYTWCLEYLTVIYDFLWKLASIPRESLQMVGPRPSPSNPQDRVQDAVDRHYWQLIVATYQLPLVSTHLEY